MRLPKTVAPAVATLPLVTRDVITQRMRDAKLPEVYRNLVLHVKQCEKLLEINYFSDAAEALAAYAKINRDNQLIHQAKRLKIWAAWSAGRAAEKLRPTPMGGDGETGKSFGARSLLMEHGASLTAAGRALRISRLTEAEMERQLREDAPVPGLNRIARLGVGRGKPGGLRPFTTSDVVAKLICTPYAAGGAPGNLNAHASFCRQHDPTSAKDFSAAEARQARKLLNEIQEWHDVFEQHLPKEARA